MNIQAIASLMSHGITVTASAMSLSTNMSNTRWEFKHAVEVTNTVDTVWIRRYIQKVHQDTAKKLCKTRTFISTSYKWFIK